MAANSYHGCAMGRFGAVIVEANNAQTLTACKEDEFRKWLGKVFEIIWNNRVHAKETQCRSHDKANYIASEFNWIDEMAFVQSYKVMEECTPPIDAIDGALHCLRLRWQRTMGFREELSSSAGIGLVPLDSVREYVNLMWRIFVQGLLRRES